jgi:GT2 family glycosyltransferase
MDLSIIIVSWNVKEKLEECLRSIEKAIHFSQEKNKKEKKREFEVFVVDNASKDGSPHLVKERFPWVHLIVNETNLGFAKANNQALRLAQGRYVLLLNPDMRLFPDTLEEMILFMDNPQRGKVGIAGCHLVDEKGKTIAQVRRFPTIFDQAAIVLKLPHLFPKLLDSYLRKDFDYNQEGRVDSIRGSFFMIRREVLEKIGLLDERFFLWFEEVDFCKRAKEAGYEIAYTPAAKCLDYVGQSFKQVAQYKKQKIFTESMLKYFKKWEPWPKWLVIALLRPIGLSLTWIAEKIGFRK